MQWRVFGDIYYTLPMRTYSAASNMSSRYRRLHTKSPHVFAPITLRFKLPRCINLQSRILSQTTQRGRFRHLSHLHDSQYRVARMHAVGAKPTAAAYSSCKDAAAVAVVSVSTRARDCCGASCVTGSTGGWTICGRTACWILPSASADGVGAGCRGRRGFSRPAKLNVG